jgi:hypothetical protein
VQILDGADIGSRLVLPAVDVKVCPVIAAGQIAGHEQDRRRDLSSVGSRLQIDGGRGRL